MRTYCLGAQFSKEAMTERETSFEEVHVYTSWRGFGRQLDEIVSCRQ